MIYYTNEDLEKIRYLDKILAGTSLEELKILADREDIVSKLKGQNTSPNMIMSMVSEMQITQAQLQTLQNDFSILKNDFIILLKKLVNPFPNSVNGIQDYEMQTLKNRYGIYN